MAPTSLTTQADAEAFATMLTEGGIPAERVSVEASNIVYSPFPYVYVFLTGDRYDGEHLLISDASEMDDDASGVLCGRYASAEAFESGRIRMPTELGSPTEALAWALKEVAS